MGSAEFGRLSFANCLGVFLSFFLGSQVSVFFVLLASAWLKPGCTVGEGKRAMGVFSSPLLWERFKVLWVLFIIGFGRRGWVSVHTFFSPRYPLFSLPLYFCIA